MDAVNPTANAVENTVAKRERTHGPFQDTASIAQALKAILRDGPGWVDMDPVFRESLDQIAAKMARIVVGHPYEPDHWRDIAGYATLAERAIPCTTAPPAPGSLEGGHGA